MIKVTKYGLLAAACDAMYRAQTLERSVPVLTKAVRAEASTWRHASRAIAQYAHGLPA